MPYLASNSSRVYHSYGSDLRLRIVVVAAQRSSLKPTMCAALMGNFPFRAPAGNSQWHGVQLMYDTMHAGLRNLHVAAVSETGRPSVMEQTAVLSVSPPPPSMLS